MYNTGIFLALVVALAGYYIDNNYSHFILPYPKSPIVTISDGSSLLGRISKSRDGRAYFEYLGIPYAQPPVGKLRFEPPLPLKKPSPEAIKKIRDARSHGEICLQAEMMSQKVQGSEDCLFLNIHTPKLGPPLKPVLVWIHGGMFAYGSANVYGADNFMDEDVVLVSLNYRVGIFGFLNTGDGLIQGNMGLKDQNMALKWVQQNIAAFGGDPSAVTIFGESAGGCSVHYHVISPMSKGLFSKAIALSGLATMPWALWRYPAEQAGRLTSQLGCTSPTAEEVVACFKNKSSSEIADVAMETMDILRPSIAQFLPTIEIVSSKRSNGSPPLSDTTPFLSDDPLTLITNGKFNRVPFMAGINDAEGLIFASAAVANRTLKSLLISDWVNTLIPLLHIHPTKDTKPDILKLLNELKFAYLGATGEVNRDQPLQHVHNFTNLFGDRWWNAGYHAGITAHSLHSVPLYPYFFTYQTAFTIADVVLAVSGDYPSGVEVAISMIKKWINVKLLGEDPVQYGTCHGDEIFMIFNIPVAITTVPNIENDIPFSKTLVKLIASFAAMKGDDSNLNILGTAWLPQTPKQPIKLMELNVKPKFIRAPYLDRIDIWKKIL